ncbi:MAG UNVERIFIED_CONTAM: DUF4147 domain-containing protein [Planctomycetaceae bacterium]
MQLREDAISIWRAGLAAVDSSAAIRRAVSQSGDQLEIAGQKLRLNSISRIEVLGAGKAAREWPPVSNLHSRVLRGSNACRAG